MFGGEKRHDENESELRSFEVFNRSAGDEKYSYADNSVRGSDAVRTTRALGRVRKIGDRSAFGTLQNVIQAQISRLQRRKSLTLSSIVTGHIPPTESEAKTETGVQTDEGLSYAPVAHTEVVYQQDCAVRERIGGLTGTFQENDHIGTTTEKGSTLYETFVDQSTLYDTKRNSSLRNDKWGYFSKESGEPSSVCVQEVRDESTEPENNNISGFHFEEFDEFLLDEREAEEVKNNIDVITLKLAENMKLEEEVNELVADLMREQEGAVGQLDSEGRQSVALKEELGQEMKNIVENLNNIPVISMKSKKVISKLRQEVELMNDKIVDLSDKTQKLGLMRGLQTVKSKLLKLVDLMERFARNNVDIRTRLRKVEYIMRRAKIRKGIGNIDENASTWPAANLAVTVFDGQSPVNRKQSQTNLVESQRQPSVAEPKKEVSTDGPAFSANEEKGSRVTEKRAVFTGTTLHRSVIEEPIVQVEKNPTFQIFPEAHCSVSEKPKHSETEQQIQQNPNTTTSLEYFMNTIFRFHGSDFSAPKRDNIGSQPHDRRTRNLTCQARNGSSETNTKENYSHIDLRGKDADEVNDIRGKHADEITLSIDGEHKTQRSGYLPRIVDNKVLTFASKESVTDPVRLQPQMVDEQTTGKMRELYNREGPPTMSEKQESSSESFDIEIIDADGDMYDIGDEIFDTDGRISLEMLERSKCVGTESRTNGHRCSAENSSTGSIKLEPSSSLCIKLLDGFAILLLTSIILVVLISLGGLFRHGSCEGLLSIDTYGIEKWLLRNTRLLSLRHLERPPF